MAMVMPTVASMPTAAMPTPYRPTSWLETAMMVQMVSSGMATDFMPMAIPAMTTVAGPVSPCLAMWRTGLEEV